MTTHEDPGKVFDLLVSFYDGDTDLLYVMRDVTATKAANYFTTLHNMLGWEVQFAIQLADSQTHYKDTSIIQPQKYLVRMRDGWMWLHDVTVFDMDKIYYEEVNHG